MLFAFLRELFDHHKSTARQGANWPLDSFTERNRPSGNPDFGKNGCKNHAYRSTTRKCACSVFEVAGEAQEVQNTVFFPLQEKFHAVVSKGVRNISGPLSNPAMKFPL